MALPEVKPDRVQYLILTFSGSHKLDYQVTAHNGVYYCLLNTIISVTIFSSQTTNVILNPKCCVHLLLSDEGTIQFE